LVAFVPTPQLVDMVNIRVAPAPRLSIYFLRAALDNFKLPML
jgi:hypothetical protein